MSGKEGAGKAAEAARAARRNRYVQRLIEDEDLRENILAAYAAARSAYGRMHNGKPATKALFEDRKLQRELTEAAKALRDASASLGEKPQKKKRRKGAGRTVLLVLLASVLALVLSEGLRSKVLDLLFGAEEEFDYSSTTTPSQPAPAATESASASAS
jgi:adenylosuccinate synthase